MSREPLPWTGERFIPNEGGPEIFYEHAHRYQFARAAVAGTVVVDLASGEGYGAAWLAEAASKVIGIDIDPATVHHAAAQYADSPNLLFTVGDIEHLPFEDGCVDVVTCFEAIEHVVEPQLVLEEVTRILKPGGLLLVSTPNKTVYTDERDYTNEFHVHEFYLPEFERLLAKFFPDRVTLGQRLMAGSLLWTLEEAAADDFAAHEFGIGQGEVLICPAFDEGGNHRAQSMFEPMYVLAACRLPGGADAGDDVHLPRSSVLVDPQDLLLNLFRRNLDPAAVERALARLQELDLHLVAQDADLDRARHQLKAYEIHQHALSAERDALLDRLAEEQGERADLLRRLHVEEDQRFAVVAELETERAALAGARTTYDALVAESAGARLAAERWAALERWQLVRLFRLAKRVVSGVRRRL